jgi:hypothetical protein
MVSLPERRMNALSFHSKLSEGTHQGRSHGDAQSPSAAFLIRFPVMEAIAVSVLSARS